MPAIVGMYILFFYATAFLGWCMEVICKLIQFRRFINRGFLIGPYCPIYGFGSVLIALTLSRYADEPVVVFILATVLCGTLEYVTSYLMEKLFHARWWDYSDKRFNLNGRICANTLIPFGLLGLAIIEVLKPLLFGWFALLSPAMMDGLCFALTALFLTDVLISTRVLTHIRQDAADMTGDSTEHLTAAVRAHLLQRGALVRRVLHAFPDVKIYNKARLARIKAHRQAVARDIREKRRLLREDLRLKEQEVREEMRRLREKHRH